MTWTINLELSMQVTSMNSEITSLYGNRLRIRVCGLCWGGDQLLLINHRLPDRRNFWAPPGGGLEFGQSMDQALKQEFLEETGLKVDIRDFRFAAEFIQLPLHAVELFFEVSAIGGILKTGIDPEMAPENQIIMKTEFMTWDRLKAIPDTEKHGIFKNCQNMTDLKSMAGFYRI